MSAQLTFALPHAPIYARENFFVSNANRAAYDCLTRWPDWPAHAVVLTGPSFSGKTHLATLWQRLSNAEFLMPLTASHAIARATTGSCFVLDDMELFREEDVFHLLNTVRENKGHALLTSHMPDRAFTLPDVTSRLRALPHVALDEPDDALLEALLTKLFADRQLRAPADVISWLVPRMERSYAGVHDVVARLDEASLSEGRRITLRLAQEASGL